MEQQPIITYAIIAITVLTSISVFNNPSLKARMLFNSVDVAKRGNYYRLLSSGLIHADFMHLFVNMWVLYIFGDLVEGYFMKTFGTIGGALYVILYIAGIVVSHTPALIKHHDNPYYNSLGASGATSAVVFTAIILYPLMNLYLFFIPIPIKAFIFGFLYLIYSQYMENRQIDNVAHDAHFAGAVFGVLFILILKPSAGLSFITQVNYWLNSFL